MLNRQTFAGLASVTIAAVLYSAPGLANVEIWDFSSNTQSYSGTSDGNSLSLSSAWSDTQATELAWAQTSALAVHDEGSSSPDLSIDSFTSEYDGELYTAARLSSIDLSWAMSGNQSNKTDVAAWDNERAGPAYLAGNTWADVLDSNGGVYESVGNYQNVGLGYYTVNPTEIESTDWLIGVYNPVLGSGGDAGMQLSSITTSTFDTPPDNPPGEVPVPGTAALLLAGLLALRTRRSSKVS